MKFISWNVNGIRACVKKGFLDFFNEADADIFCIQESKMQEGQLDLELPGYHQYWNYAVKKGYSGTGIFTKEEPLSVSYGLGIEEHDQEGRVITLEFENYYFITVYTPIMSKMPDLHRKNVKSSRHYLTLDSQILIDIYTQIQRSIHGGAIDLRQEKGTPDGVSIIS